MSTQLCVIPGCRIRGQHLPGCDLDGCDGCLPRTAHEGYACDVCTGRRRDQLAAIIDLAPDARLVAAGLVRRGGGGGSNKPGSRPPLNDGATDAVDAVQNALTTLARDIAETRGQPVPYRPGTDPIAVAARSIGAQLDWVRHAVDGSEPYAIQAYAEITAAAGRLRGIVNGRSEQKFLGPCGSTVAWDDDDHEIERDEPCAGDVFAPALGSQDGTCNACGARWSREKRQAWLSGEVRSRAFRAAHIADAYRVSVDTIRSWAARGKLRSYWRTEAGLTIPWTDPPLDPDLEGEALKTRLGEISDEIQARGGRLHYVGDVLDLAAAVAVARAEGQSKRARRAAVREAAESEDAA